MLINALTYLLTDLQFLQTRLLGACIRALHRPKLEIGLHAFISAAAHQSDHILPVEARVVGEYCRATAAAG